MVKSCSRKAQELTVISPPERCGGGLTSYATAGPPAVPDPEVFNEAPGHSSALGGALAVGYRGTFLIERNIIALTVAGGGIYCDPRGTPVIRDNLVWENTGGHGVGSCVGWELGSGNMVADPRFCDVALDEFTVARFSPALTHPAAPLGAYPDPGCEPVRVEAASWGRIKKLYR